MPRMLDTEGRGTTCDFSARDDMIREHQANRACPQLPLSSVINCCFLICHLCAGHCGHLSVPWLYHVPSYLKDSHFSRTFLSSLWTPYLLSKRFQEALPCPFSPVSPASLYSINPSSYDDCERSNSLSRQHLHISYVMPQRHGMFPKEREVNFMFTPFTNGV